MTTIDTAPNRLEKLTEISTGYKAFLYDCDGTLADNMEAHRQTYIKVALDKGFVLNGDIIDELAGWPTTKVIEEINRRNNTNFDPQEFNDLKYRLYLDEYIDQIKPIDFVVDHLKAHVGKVKIGVVSGGSREAIEKTLRIIGIDTMVEVVVCAGETERGKPYPDPFLAAAEQLGVAPTDCLVFEDGEAGVIAAEAAGMKWVRIDKI